MTLVVPDEVTVDLALMTLDQLAERANIEHALVEQEVSESLSHLSAAVRHGILAGRALLRSQEIVPFGQFSAWLEAQSLDFSRDVANVYMRFAEFEEELVSSDQPLTIDTAKVYLARLGLIRCQGGRPIAEEKQAEILRLREAGMSQEGIAEVMGVSRVTVRSYLDPEFKKWRIQQRRDLRKRQAAARKALAEKEARAERDRLAKSTGGDLSAMYADVRKALARKVLDDAKPNQTDDIKTAIAALHKAEDAIVAAMRSGRVA